MVTIPMKTCSNPECGKTLPATVEFFHRQKANKDGLRGYCRACQNEYRRGYKQSNKEKVSASTRKYYLANKDIRLEYQSKYYEANRETILEYRKEYQSKYYEANRETILKQRHEDGQVNKETIREQRRKLRKANPDIFRIRQQRRRARKRSLPDTFTVDQWHHCLEYFNYCCAVCGKQLRDLFGNVKPHADHWHPLAVEGCPGTVAENMICLCNGCNLSKQDILPDVWLTRKYGTRKAQEILARIEAYFAWIRSQNEGVA